MSLFRVVELQTEQLCRDDTLLGTAEDVSSQGLTHQRNRLVSNQVQFCDEGRVVDTVREGQPGHKMEGPKKVLYSIAYCTPGHMEAHS